MTKRSIVKCVHEGGADKSEQPGGRDMQYSTKKGGNNHKKQLGKEGHLRLKLRQHFLWETFVGGGKFPLNGVTE